MVSVVGFLLALGECLEWLTLELDFHCFSIGLMHFRLIFIGKLKASVGPGLPDFVQQFYPL
jgi:hypothetical protein